MAKRKRTRGVRGAGTITQLPGGQWRLRVTLGGRQVDYGFYSTEELAGDAQARWRLTHLLPHDDPQCAVEFPASVAGGVSAVTSGSPVGRTRRGRDDSGCGSTTSAEARILRRPATGPTGRSGGSLPLVRSCRT
jgi:hypothetical protein